MLYKSCFAVEMKLFRCL